MTRPTPLVALGLAASESQNQATAVARNTFLSLTSAAKVLLVRNIWVFDQAPNFNNTDIQILSYLCRSNPSITVNLSIPEHGQIHPHIAHHSVVVSENAV